MEGKTPREMKPSQRETTRRDFVTSSAVTSVSVLATALLRNRGIPSIYHEPISDSLSSPPTPTLPPTEPAAVGGTDTLHPETEMSLESQLVAMYGSGMNESVYKTQQDKETFMSSLIKTAHSLNPENPNLARQLAAAINFETDGTFSPSKTNIDGATVDSDYDGAVGLIQFTKIAAEDLGISLPKLAQMEPVEQLTYVEELLSKQFSRHSVSPTSAADLYMSILYPKAMGGPLTEVIFSKNTDDDSVRQLYESNPMDFDHDGNVTKGEATVLLIQRALDKGEKLENLVNPDQIDYLQPILKLNSQIENINRIISINHETSKDLRQGIVDANSNVIHDAENGLYTSIPNFGKDRSLDGVRITLDQAYAGELSDEMAHINRADEIVNVFADHPDKFKEVVVDNDIALEYLPVGTIIVFNSGEEEASKVVIVRPNNEKGESVNGSDHESLLAQDLSEMQNGYRVFIPVASE